MSVEGIVTGTAYNGLYVQDPAGGPSSGIWVFADPGWDAAFGAVARGDRVRVVGRYQEANGLSQLSLLDAASPAIVALGAAGEPAPAAVTVAALAADGEPWEGVLVRVDPVLVSDPDPGFGEFVVVDAAGVALVVDDQMHWYSRAASGELQAGEPLDALTGIVTWSFGTFKLEPRDEADVVSPVHTGDTAVPADTSGSGA
ncbi:MAG: hypothetical protein R3F59_15535 [Myxococcota bacterium]